jgi:hypothetical protein
MNIFLVSLTKFHFISLYSLEDGIQGRTDVLDTSRFRVILFFFPQTDASSRTKVWIPLHIGLVHSPLQRLQTTKKQILYVLCDFACLRKYNDKPCPDSLCIDRDSNCALLDTSLIISAILTLLLKHHKGCVNHTRVINTSHAWGFPLGSNSFYPLFKDILNVYHTTFVELNFKTKHVSSHFHSFLSEDKARLISS